MGTARGTTLVELVMVLSVIGLLLMLAVGEGGRLLDYQSVHLAREEVAGLVSQARMAARIHGGATLRIHENGLSVLLSPTGETLESRDPSHLGVRVVPRVRIPPADLHFGPTGLGRAASLTIDFERGSVRRALVLSSYGRLRRDG